MRKAYMKINADIVYAEKVTENCKYLCRNRKCQYTKVKMIHLHPDAYSTMCVTPGKSMLIFSLPDSANPRGAIHKEKFFRLYQEKKNGPSTL